MRGRRINVRCDVVNPAMSVFKSRHWRQRMVYVLRADRRVGYKKGSSRVVYIGETGKGKEMRRPARSASWKASEAFGRLHGVSRIDVHFISFRGKQRVRTWELLEKDLLAVFRDTYGELPQYNGKGKRYRVEDIKYFRKKRLQDLLLDLA